MMTFNCIGLVNCTLDFCSDEEEGKAEDEEEGEEDGEDDCGWRKK